jgi:hypothetical protein
MLKAQGNRVPPAPRPPSAVDRRHIYLAEQANRTALELLQAASRDVNGYQIFVVPGTAAVARTKIKRPVFLVPGGIASSLELYELAIQGGSRVVVYMRSKTSDWPPRYSSRSRMQKVGFPG